MTSEDGRYFTRDHEWFLVDGDLITVGITEYAAEQLGDIVFVEEPRLGAAAGSGETILEIESTKSVGEILAPVPGEIVEANVAAREAPELVNQDPLGAGWLVRLRTDAEVDASDFLDAASYAAYLAADAEGR